MKLHLKEILKIAEARFKNEDCLNPKLDAELLFCYLVNKDRSWLYLHYGDQLRDETCEEYFKLVDLRAGGKPVQYIIGRQEFMGLPFYVDEKVLIPRQDTELLVEKAIELVEEKYKKERKISILDLCSGSGAIAVSLAAKLEKMGRNYTITASDISRDAIEIAKKNSKLNGVYKKIRFTEGDLFKPFPKNRRGYGKKTFHIIVSNPPYIPSEVIPTLMREVRDHEPTLALDGGKEGIDYYIDILNEGYLYLKKGGLMLLEIGHDQGETILGLIENTKKYQEGEIFQDYSGKDRLALVKPLDN